SSVLKRSDYAISAGLAQPAIAASKISEFFVVTQYPTAEWLARQITILDLAAGDVDHELGELGGVAGAFAGGLVMRPPSRKSFPRVAHQAIRGIRRLPVRLRLFERQEAADAPVAPSRPRPDPRSQPGNIPSSAAHHLSALSPL